jgi:flagellin-like protein
MRVKQMLQEDDAVSPVIGVILMVAITVILAAVIASFVLGLGGQADDVAPNTNFQFDYDGDTELEVSVSGGQTVQASRLSFSGNNINEFDGEQWDTVPGSTYDEGSQLSAGDSITGDVGGSNYEIDIVWTSQDGGTSSTLASDSGPDS